MSKIRKMFVRPLYIFLLLLKYGTLGFVIQAEVDLIFKLLKATFMGFDITIWSVLIVVTGFNLAIHFLLRRLPIKWERFDPKKLSEKILRLDEI